VPDVAIDADPATGFVICQADKGGCPNGLLYGGTSAAAPLWAGVVAFINQVLGRNVGALNPQLYALGGTNAFHSAVSMGSDFAHVGLGSPNTNQLLLALAGHSAGAVSPSTSSLLAFPEHVPADGVGQSILRVALLDTNGNAVAGKTVSLQKSGGTHAVVSGPSGLSQTTGGTVTFTATDSTSEDVTFTATDTTDNQVLQQTAVVHFVSPPATAGGITATPSVPADGTTTGTVTVRLQNALGQGAAGKVVSLSQGNGHSRVTGPTPAVTGSNGQVTFTVTDTVTEQVSYSAIDVTDGNLPLPTQATVSFTNGGGAPCATGTPAAAAGYAFSIFASGFANGNCAGPIGVTFDPAGNLWVGNVFNGLLYKFGPAGGAASAATQVNGGPTNFDPHGMSFSKDGAHLFLVRYDPHDDVVELNMTDGSVRRTVATGFNGPVGIATDPLSGDLFVTSIFSDIIARINNPLSQTPTVTFYATVGHSDGITFAPDGTLFTRTLGGNNVVSILRINGTNTAQPGMVTQTIPVNSNADGVAVTANAGQPQFLFINRNDGTISRLDLSQAQPTETVVFSGGSRGDFVAVGPDGCLYATQTDSVLRLTNSNGSCPFATTSPFPTVSLSPITVPNSLATGTPITFTATLQNVPNPAGTPVTFIVNGANLQTRLVHADANGVATFSYAGIFPGADTVVATIGSGRTAAISNKTAVTWTPGNHTTFVNLNGSATADSPNLPVTLTGNLSDLSTQPAATPLAGQTLSFSLSGAGGQSCTGTTDATGTASCTITPTAPPGSYTLTVSFAATGQDLASSDSTGFTLVAGSQPLLQTATPASGTARGGQAITVAGTNIQSGASVSIGGQAAGNVVVNAGGTSVSATTPGYIHWGDVSGDDLMTPLDAQCILRLIASLPATQNCPTAALTVTVPLVVSNPGGGSAVVAGGYTYKTADVSGDGAISPLDAQCVLRAIASLAATQNCPAPVPPGVPARGQPRALPPRH
ncbi:MAG: Ig-like domain-containing protein, partial [Dehalococcoidia bacterium]